MQSTWSGKTKHNLRADFYTLSLNSTISLCQKRSWSAAIALVTFFVFVFASQPSPLSNLHLFPADATMKPPWRIPSPCVLAIELLPKFCLFKNSIVSVSRRFAIATLASRPYDPKGQVQPSAGITFHEFTCFLGSTRSPVWQPNAFLSLSRAIPLFNNSPAVRVVTLSGTGPWCYCSLVER